MISIGLTGNVASGKTTVAERWREAGVRVIDADRLGHDVLREDESAREALVEAFGEGVLAPDGAIDRALLGERAFADDAGVRRLNAIVHPPLLGRLRAARERAARSGATLVVVDAALIFEFGMEDDLDAVSQLATRVACINRSMFFHGHTHEFFENPDLLKAYSEASMQAHMHLHDHK